MNRFRISRMGRAVSLATALILQASVLQPLRAQTIPEAARPEAAATASSPQASSAEPARSPGDIQAEHEQSMYRMNVRRAIASARFLTVTWPMKLVEKLVTEEKPFDEDASKIMTLHAQALVGVGAPMLELEVPALHAEWNNTMSLMDRAQSAGLYRPPEDLRQGLVFWRAARDDLAATDAAPWIKGPAKVTVDPALAEITVPADVWYLGPAQCAALAKKRTEIRKAARATLTGKPARAPADPPLPGVACLRAADRSWNASLAVVDRGYMEMDAGFPSRAGPLLSRVRSRSNPVSKLNFKVDGSYSEAAVRWVVAPQLDAGKAAARWALTDGVQKQPIGIDYAFMKFGASQQVLITGDHLRAAEIVAQIDDLPEGYAKERFSAEYTVAQLQKALAPLEESLAFLPGHRYEDANADTPRSPNSRGCLIAGPPSEMERAIKRISEKDERRRNVFLFLWYHPLHFVLLVLVVLAAIAHWGKGRRTAGKN